ncbi:MAG: N-acetyltransferase [Actinomycetota bacterium]|nr:N-acetyltransferase [Actinomycetota bacterium]
MNVEVTDNAEAQRFEALADGVPAGFVQYRRKDGQIRLVHAEVEDGFEGKGVASTMVRQTLDMVRESGMEVLPDCPFVASYLKRHAEFLDLVPAEQRARFGLPPVPIPPEPPSGAPAQL